MPVTRAMSKRNLEGTSSNDEVVSPCSSSRETDYDEESPLVEPKKHPLLNDLILSTLFEFVGPNDLKECRLVCKKWNILAIPHVRSKLKVRIYGYRTDPAIGTCPVKSIRTIEDFMKLIHTNTLGIELQNFELGNIDPTVGVGQEFISRFGKGIKSLHLYVHNGVHMVEHISAILQSTPNLEDFGMPGRMCSERGSESVVKFNPPTLPFLKSFENSFEKPDGRRKNCPTFLEELFTAAENISSVYLNDYDDPISNPGTIIEILQVLENLGRESALENLIVSRVRVSHLNTLGRMASNGLKLKHLRILHGLMPLLDPDPEPTWLQLIELFAETLITLGVCYGECRLTEFPRMPQLKILDMQIPEHGDLRCERINFINTFPSLESLRMIRKGGHYTYTPNGPLALYEFFNGNDICPNMKTLSLRDGFDLTTNQTLERALKIFPNLYELELNIESAELLQHIWVNMSGLVKLHLYGKLNNENIENCNMDSLFTGITPQDIKKIGDYKRHSRRLQRMPEEDRRQTLQNLVERHRTLPSIINLTSLRFLSLSIPEGWCWATPWESKCMTDLTGYLGLYFLKNLQELRLWNCAFSRTCIMILLEDIDLESFNFKQCAWEEVEDYVQSYKKPYNGIRRNKLLEFDYRWRFGN